MQCEGFCAYWFYFQVVRYHSLVIEAGSLPDDLISIAWTASPNLLSYLESDRTNVSTFLGSLDNFMAIPLEHSNSGGKLSSINNGNANESYGSRVIMAIRHSSRPHYGVQVLQFLLYNDFSKLQQTVLTHVAFYSVSSRERCYSLWKTDFSKLQKNDKRFWIALIMSSGKKGSQYW